MSQNKFDSINNLELEISLEQALPSFWLQITPLGLNAYIQILLATLFTIRIPSISLIRNILVRFYGLSN